MKLFGTVVKGQVYLPARVLLVSIAGLVKLTWLHRLLAKSRRLAPPLNTCWSGIPSNNEDLIFRDILNLLRATVKEPLL